MALKVALIFRNYGPYHLARIRSCLNQFQQKGWEIVGIELARSDTEYPWKTQVVGQTIPIYSVLLDQKVEQVSFHRLVDDLYQLLDKINPDVLAIAGYYSPSMLATLAWSLWRQKLVVLLSDSKKDDAPRRKEREILKGWIVRQYHSALVAGQPHKHYLMDLGMSDRAIFLGYDVVENESFHPSKIKLLTRQQLKPYFLVISRFLPRKNLQFVISAYANYRKLGGSNLWDLVIGGDGQLRPQIEQQVVEQDLENCVHLLGFLQQDELLPYFAHASCFIHASIQEQWGLVVNEAMAAGLPVLVSDRCGCFQDLVLQGIDGFGFDPENMQELTNLMVKLSSGAVDLEAMGQASLKHIQKFSLDYFVQGLTQAIEHALAYH